MQMLPCFLIETIETIETIEGIERNVFHRPARGASDDSRKDGEGCQPSTAGKG